ncbi:hypothetical protein GCM10009069_04330 [Algimonas arctica]|uniref:Uncharacterized protein n=1 Tax=Algimonas arctica TaxID=1479486 RepID=A0A8J3G1E0_9PROT|nr:hypothetical protein GCM10009069_04330 [Algimonas arctica]
MDANLTSVQELIHLQNEQPKAMRAETAFLRSNLRSVYDKDVDIEEVQSGEQRTGWHTEQWFCSLSLARYSARYAILRTAGPDSQKAAKLKLYLPQLI